MTINGEKHVDEFVCHETTFGYRNLSLSFKLKKGEPEPVPYSKHDEIEINLNKEDVAQLLKVFFDLYKEVYEEIGMSKDYEVSVEEIRGVLGFHPEFS